MTILCRNLGSVTGHRITIHLQSSTSSSSDFFMPAFEVCDALNNKACEVAPRESLAINCGWVLTQLICEIVFPCHPPQDKKWNNRWGIFWGAHFFQMGATLNIQYIWTQTHIYFLHPSKSYIVRV